MRDWEVPLRRSSRSFSCKPVARLVAVLALCVAVVPLEATADHQGSQHYSRDTFSCPPGELSNLADPIGIVFYGENGSAPGGHSFIADGRLEGIDDPEHDWVDSNSQPQFVGSGMPNVCTDTEHQAATPKEDIPGDGWMRQARYHIRLNQNEALLDGRFATVATPHYDLQTQECGDAVPPNIPNMTNGASGFDYARGHIKNDWLDEYGGIPADIQNWRNTRRLVQCKDEWAPHSSGRVYYLDTDAALRGVR